MFYQLFTTSLSPGRWFILLILVPVELKPLPTDSATATFHFIVHSPEVQKRNGRHRIFPSAVRLTLRNSGSRSGLNLQIAWKMVKTIAYPVMVVTTAFKRGTLFSS